MEMKRSSYRMIASVPNHLLKLVAKSVLRFRNTK